MFNRRKVLSLATHSLATLCIGNTAAQAGIALSDALVPPSPDDAIKTAFDALKIALGQKYPGYAIHGNILNFGEKGAIVCLNCTNEA
jgi:hypothetical protein